MRVGDKVVVSRNVHFVEGKRGALALGRVATEHGVTPTVEGEPPVVSEDKFDEEHDTSPLPITTPNPFQPLLDLDNVYTLEEATSSSSSTNDDQQCSTVPEHSSGSPTSTEKETATKCTTIPPTNA